MKILKETVSKLGNKIQLLGNDYHKNILVIGVFMVMSHKETF